jgi:hypothetical protein
MNEFADHAILIALRKSGLTASCLPSSVASVRAHLFHRAEKTGHKY